MEIQIMLSFGESFNFTFVMKNQMKWNTGRSCSTYSFMKFKDEINFMFTCIKQFFFFKAFERRDVIWFSKQQEDYFIFAFNNFFSRKESFLNFFYAYLFKKCFCHKTEKKIWNNVCVCSSFWLLTFYVGFQWPSKKWKMLKWELNPTFVLAHKYPLLARSK